MAVIPRNSGLVGTRSSKKSTIYPLTSMSDDRVCFCISFENNTSKQKTSTSVDCTVLYKHLYCIRPASISVPLIKRNRVSRLTKRYIIDRMLSNDLTTPLSGVVCHLGLTTSNLASKFEVFISTLYNDTKGEKWGGLGNLGVLKVIGNDAIR